MALLLVNLVWQFSCSFCNFLISSSLDLCISVFLPDSELLEGRLFLAHPHVFAAHPGSGPIAHAPPMLTQLKELST